MAVELAQLAVADMLMLFFTAQLATQVPGWAGTGSSVGMLTRVLCAVQLVALGAMAILLMPTRRLLARRRRR